MERMETAANAVLPDEDAAEGDDASAGGEDMDFVAEGDELSDAPPRVFQRILEV